MRDGFFGELLLHSTDSLVSDYAFTNLFLDFRGTPWRQRGLQELIGQSGGGTALQRAGVLGGDSIMRATTGRYRDRTLTAAQTRAVPASSPRLLNRIGAAAWVAAGP